MNDVRWEGLTHEEIYARVQQGPGRVASADAEAAWGTVESTIRAVDDQLSHAVKQIGIDWQGAAADTVRGGMTVMSNWALDAAGDALLTRDGITGQADAAGHVRTAMPPPRSAALDAAVQQGLNGAGYVPRSDDVGALEDQIAADRARAVDLMNRYTSDSSSNQRLMNYWTPPPSVVVETVAPGGGGGVGLGTGLGGAVGAVAGVAAAGLTASRVGGPATGAEAGRGSAAGEVDPGPGAGAGGASAGTGVLAGQGGPTRTAPGSTARAAPADPTSAPGVPGAGPPPAGAGVPGGGAARRPRAPVGGLPTGGVRPVVPGPPARTSGDLLPDGRGIPRGTPLLPGSPSRSAAGPIGEGLERGGSAGPPYRGARSTPRRAPLPARRSAGRPRGRSPVACPTPASGSPPGAALRRAPRASCRWAVRRHGPATRTIAARPTSSTTPTRSPTTAGSPRR